MKRLQKTATLTIRLPVDLKEALQEAAAASDRTVTEFLCRAARKELGLRPPRLARDLNTLLAARQWLEKHPPREGPWARDEHRRQLDAFDTLIGSEVTNLIQSVGGDAS